MLNSNLNFIREAPKAPSDSCPLRHGVVDVFGLWSIRRSQCKNAQKPKKQPKNDSFDSTLIFLRSPAGLPHPPPSSCELQDSPRHQIGTSEASPPPSEAEISNGAREQTRKILPSDTNQWVSILIWYYIFFNLVLFFWGGSLIWYFFSLIWYFFWFWKGLRSKSQVLPRFWKDLSEKARFCLGFGRV